MRSRTASPVPTTPAPVGGVERRCSSPPPSTSTPVTSPTPGPPVGRPYAKSVLERLWCDANIAGVVFGTDGEVLWQGRKHRTATDTQIDALIVRDGGCVLCGAHYQRCQAHHLTPYNSPARGATDVDAMALVCQACHHLIHDDNLTLYRSNPPPNAPPGDPPPRIIWNTRPATPAETPTTGRRSRVRTHRRS